MVLLGIVLNNNGILYLYSTLQVDISFVLFNNSVDTKKKWGNSFTNEVTNNKMYDKGIT